ncbi:AGC/AKT protein kinase [Saprolegnia diclina VS20]|uniref:AGC/AKT protein kinase n=1 Tax=Saprolegnia diclina (strain VS20) TaxID=1156394 RepID=T0Q3H8_SAPDV|nr:AGC/AKT protein kinase [Saprolegnia diclina VS20]EQC32389.1 AGC/AKT protein kinase [Saprolegnia diclina VS20]|eukprot:XP_008614330.1 AGC/AKT protein kinase [Saprolegnia diclina VS20]
MTSSFTGQQAVANDIRHVAGQVQARLRGDLHFTEEFIPSARAEARSSIFVSSDWSTNPRMCVFLQCGPGVVPGLWAIPRPPNGPSSSAFTSALHQMSMLPYARAAIQNGQSVVIMNPSTNFGVVKGQKVKILHSATPEDHVAHVWNTYIAPSSAGQINFVVLDVAGLLLNQFLRQLGPEHHGRIGGVVYVDAPQAARRHRSEPPDFETLIETRSIHFEPSSEPMFQVVSNANQYKCTSLSIGRFSGDHSVASVIQSVQASAFMFLQLIGNGLDDAMLALRATIPNKLVVTVNRARLTGQPYNNPYAVVTCVGQKKETVGNHRKTMDPEWNQTFSFPVSDAATTVVVTVKDKTFPLSTSLGHVALGMTDIGLNRPVRKWFTLRDERSSSSHGNGELELTLEWVHDTFVARTDSFIRGQRGNTAARPPSGGAPPIIDTKPANAAENQCYLCKCSFLMHRRRHCRMCLRPVCVSCSDRLFLPGFSEAKRVCTACCNLQIMIHKQGTNTGSARTASSHLTTRHPSPLGLDVPTPYAVLPYTHQGGHAPVQMVYDQAALDEASRNIERMVAREKEKDMPLGIDDFDLMKVVGRGAFGKVMLVRKKAGKNGGAIYAMKILKKAHIIQNDQVENTKAEQHILKEINHPYVVRLRYAFQNPEKLYLIMDYYPGGSLYYHLRKSKKFSEDRTRLYMAQLLTAIMHLHSKDIAYRDLKLENILMDAHGHIALTDFGLSKEGQSVDGAIRQSQAQLGMKTICGTAEYMAPELLRHQAYGKVVDWWSYGILLFEMLTGRTPFVDKNRRTMFKNIMHSEVVYPPYISATARSVIARLLTRDPSKRLGGGPNGGTEIMAHPFFAPIDWDALLRKELSPVFLPNVSAIDDVSNVPEMFQKMAAIDSPIAKDGKALAHFDDFSYQEDTNLRQQ